MALATPGRHGLAASFCDLRREFKRTGVNGSEGLVLPGANRQCNQVFSDWSNKKGRRPEIGRWQVIHILKGQYIGDGYRLKQEAFENRLVSALVLAAAT
jgi:hypothetical protein